MLLPWLRAFLLTQLCEVPIAGTLLGSGSGPWHRRILLSAYASLSTHPVVWFVFPQLEWNWMAVLATAEIWALVTEAGLFLMAAPSVGWKRCLAASAAANAASFLLGLVVYWVFPDWLSSDYLAY